MNTAILRSLSTIAMLLVALGCTGATPVARDRDGSSAIEPVVERESTDGVETVRTLAGSRWEATPTLVEELSIGEEAGEEAYLFGSVTAAWATADRIYIVDPQVPAVRAFDHDGGFLLDVGHPGQGPGEYILPAGIAVTPERRVVVAAVMGARVNVYDETGVFIEDWPLGSQKGALDLTLDSSGNVFTQAWSNDAGRMGVQRVEAGGAAGDIRFPPLVDFEQPSVSVGKGMRMIVPFAPAYTWTFAPGGELIAGTGSSYRIEVAHSDGRRSAIERAVEPEPVAAAEADFRALLASAAIRAMVPEGGLSAAKLPRSKPAFHDFFADRAGRLWVIRPGPGRADPTCLELDNIAAPRLIMETPAGPGVEVAGKAGFFGPDGFQGECWADTFVFDLFEIASGEFLGTLIPPESGFRRPLFADERSVLAAVTDDAGTVRLKKYRLQRH